MVIIPDCLSGDGSSILPRVAKFCPGLLLRAGFEARRRQVQFLLGAPSFAVMVWGRGPVLRILVSRSGSSPLAAPNFCPCDGIGIRV